MISRLIPLAAAFALVLSANGPASAGERSGDRFGDRPGVGEPLRFRDANGGAFRPSALIILSAAGTQIAPLPSTTNSARSEDRVDLSEIPLIGGLFGETLSTDDAREGRPVGKLQRVGDTLVLDARGSGISVTSLPVVMATNLPRHGAVSYRLGRLNYRPGGAGGVGPVLGAAYEVDGKLVLASTGGEAAWPSLEAMFDDLLN